MKIFQKIALLFCASIIFLFPSCMENQDSKVSAIQLNAQAIELYIGEDFALSANVKGASWKSEDENVAVVDSKGRISALSVGETSISAEKSGLCAECSVVVKKREVPSTESVAFSENSLFIGVNESRRLNISVYKNGGITKETASLSSSNDQVATISSEGVVFAQSEGTAILTATYGAAQATCTVYVSDNAVDFSIGQASFVMQLGEELDVSSYLNVESEEEKPAFSVSNANVTILEDGKAFAAIPGESVLRITYRGQTAYCCIQVYQEKWISTVEEFISIKSDSYVNYKLAQDLDFADYDWQNKNVVEELSSTLDGNGRKIYNVRRRIASDRVGFFGKITQTGCIRNLAVYVDTFLYKDNCGALALYNYGKIENSYVKISASAHATTTAELLRSGVVYENYGEMNCLLVDVVAKFGGANTVNFHAFAARNFGRIRNGLVISSASATRSVDSATRVYYHLLSGSSDTSHYNGYGYLNVSTADNSCDKRRENCYIFLKEGELRSLGNGGVAIDGSKGMVEQEAISSLEVSSREILAEFSPEIWTINENEIGFFSLILYKE